jgi:hypothetical protein
MLISSDRGGKIGVECGKCKALTIVSVGADQSFLHGFTCDLCKAKYAMKPDAHDGVKGAFVYADDEGHVAKLFQAL